MREAARLLLPGLLTPCLLLGGTGCKAFDESLLTPMDAGTVECVPASPPPRPGTGDADGPERLYALRNIRLEQGSDWRSIGRDLDGLCSDGPDPPVECVPPDVAAGTEEDGDDGIDNSVGHTFFNTLVVLSGALQEPIRAHQELGLGSLLLRLRGYNGADEDPSVEVAFAPTAFGSAADAGGATPPLPPPGSLPPNPPVWDGTDWFWADESAFLMSDPEMPRIVDDQAYVSGRTLVARLPDRTVFPLSAETYSMDITLSDPILTARISLDGSELESVILSGRWDLLELESTFGRLGFCDGTANRDRLIRNLMEIADVRLVPGTGGDGVTCDAASAGFELTGTAIQLAGLTTAPTRVTPCE